MKFLGFFSLLALLRLNEAQRVCRELRFRRNSDQCTNLDPPVFFYVNEQEVDFDFCFGGVDGRDCRMTACGDASNPALNFFVVFTLETSPFVYSLRVDGEEVRPSNLTFPAVSFVPGPNDGLVDATEFLCENTPFNSRQRQVCNQCLDDDEEDFVIQGGPNWLYYNIEDFNLDNRDNDENEDNGGVVIAAAGFGVLAVGGLLLLVRKKKQKAKSVRESSRLLESPGGLIGKASDNAPEAIPSIVPVIIPVRMSMEDMTAAEAIAYKSKRKQHSRRKGAAHKSGKSKSSKSKGSSRRPQPSMNTLASGVTILTTETKKTLIKNSHKLLDNRTDVSSLSAILSRISTLSLNTAPNQNISGLSHKKNVVSLIPKEKRVQFISERVSWKSYADSEALYEKTDVCIDMICDKLSAVTLSEEDIKSSPSYDKDKDFYAGQSVPGISLASYLRILVRALDEYHEETNYTTAKMKGAGIRSVVLSLIYLGRIKDKEKYFVLTVYNQHRLFAVTMLLAQKMMEDESMINPDWAEIAGLEIEDLNEVEAEFCKVMDFDLLATEAEMRVVYTEFGLQSLLD